MLKALAAKSTTVKVLASTVFLGGAVTVAGLGTFGAFTDTTTAQQAVASGRIYLTINGGVTKSAEIKGMVPGDTYQDFANLARAADSEEFGSLVIESNPTGEAGLIDALRIKVETCTGLWSKGTNGELACAGARSTIGTVTNVRQGATLSAASLRDTLNGSSRQLNVAGTFTFQDRGAAIDNELQGKSADLHYTFTTTHRPQKNL